MDSVPCALIVEFVFESLPLKDKVRVALCSSSLLRALGGVRSVVVSREAECRVATWARFAGLRELRAAGVGRETVLRLGCLLGALPSLEYLEVVVGGHDAAPREHDIAADPEEGAFSLSISMLSLRARRAPARSRALPAPPSLVALSRLVSRPPRHARPRRV